MTNNYDNTVILSQGGEHGTLIIEWWEKQNADTGFYLCNEYGFYYGLIDGKFGIYTLYDVQKASAKIIELPVAYLSSTDWKAFARDINKQDLIGRKVRGFKFEADAGVTYFNEMDKHIGEIGTIIRMESLVCTVRFKDDHWWYPTSIIHEYLVDDDTNVDTSEQNVDTSPQIIDLSNVEGVEMMVSLDEKHWCVDNIVAKCKNKFINSDGDYWNYAKPIEPVKKVTMQEVEELFGCKVEIVKED